MKLESAKAAIMSESISLVSDYVHFPLEQIGFSAVLTAGLCPILTRLTPRRRPVSPPPLLELSFQAAASSAVKNPRRIETSVRSDIVHLSVCLCSFLTETSQTKSSKPDSKALKRLYFSVHVTEAQLASCHDSSELHDGIDSSRVALARLRLVFFFFAGVSRRRS